MRAVGTDLETGALDLSAYQEEQKETIITIIHTFLAGGSSHPPEHFPCTHLTLQCIIAAFVADSVCVDNKLLPEYPTKLVPINGSDLELDTR
jgi:hypothetical protein